MHTENALPGRRCRLDPQLCTTGAQSSRAGGSGTVAIRSKSKSLPPSGTGSCRYCAEKTGSVISTWFLRRQFALCAVPADHRLARQSAVRLEDLPGERFVAPVANTPYRILFDRAFKTAGVEPDIRFEVRTQHGMLIRRRRRRHCLSRAMRCRGRRRTQRGISTLRTADLLGYRADRAEVTLCQNLIDHLVDHAHDYFFFNKPQLATRV